LLAALCCEILSVEECATEFVNERDTQGRRHFMITRRPRLKKTLRSSNSYLSALDLRSILRI